MAKPASKINIRNLSVKCGRCGQYQVLAAFAPLDEEWNVYTFECDWPPCDEDREASQTLVEVPVDLDEFANRDPKWGGGKKHAGAQKRAESDGAQDESESSDGSVGLVTLGSG